MGRFVAHFHIGGDVQWKCRRSVKVTLYEKHMVYMYMHYQSKKGKVPYRNCAVPQEYYEQIDSKPRVNHEQTAISGAMWYCECGLVRCGPHLICMSLLCLSQVSEYLSFTCTYTCGPESTTSRFTPAHLQCLPLH